MELNEISAQVVDAAMKVHSALGPGLLEEAYEACLKHELQKRGLTVKQQIGLPVVYEGVKIDLARTICHHRNKSSGDSDHLEILP